MLTDRERYLLKVAVAAALEAVQCAIAQSTQQMLERQAANPESGSYYLPHRQFEELVYVLMNIVENRTCYDDDLAMSLSGTVDVNTVLNPLDLYDGG